MQTRKSSLPLSQLFFEAVKKVDWKSRNQQQVNSKSAKIDRLSTRSNSQLAKDDNRLPSKHHDNRLPSEPHDSSVDASGLSSETSTESSACESSSVSSTVQPTQNYPLTSDCFKFLLDDAADRYAEASKFFYATQVYSFMFEFYIQVLNDLLEEMASPPNIEAEDMQSASTLCQRLRLLLQHLIARRNLLLGGNCSADEKIRAPAGAEVYLEAAAEAKAARQRQYQMVALVQTITELKTKEEQCKQQRLEAEAELMRYFDRFKQSEGDGRQEYEGTSNETASAGRENCRSGNEVESSSSQVRQGDEFESTPTSHTGNDLYDGVSGGEETRRIDDDVRSISSSHVRQDDENFGNRTRNGSEIDLDGNETCQNGADANSSSTRQVRRDDNVSEKSSTDRSPSALSNDLYCILWMESSEREKSSAANQKTPPYLRLKPSSTCVFCHELHWSHLCLQLPTLEGRRRFYRQRGMCFVCGWSHSGACTDPQRGCRWPQCRAINSHHSALCPKVEYPITVETIQAFERRINELNRMYNRPQVGEW